MHYGTMNHTLWWFIHVSCVFWKVVFPIHARSYQSKYTYIHIALVIAGLAIPIPSVIAGFATGGYVNQAFPPQICTVENPDAQYYSLWLFINLLLIAGITMLIIICWKVHKVKKLSYFLLTSFCNYCKSALSVLYNVPTARRFF